MAWCRGARLKLARLRLARCWRGGDWQARLRHTRLTRFGVTVLAAGALVVTAGSTAAALTLRGSRLPAAGAARAAQAARLPVAYNGVSGWQHGQVRPHVIYLGGSTAFLRIARWSRWTGASAAGDAVLWVDTCQPTCAAGHYRTYPATVRLSRAADRAGAGFFSRMRLRYEHGGPRDYGFRWGTYRGATVPVWIGGPGG